MNTKPENISCRPGATEAMERLAAENEALRVERDEAQANAAKLRSAIIYTSHYLDSNPKNTIGHHSKAHMELFSTLLETPAQSLAYIKAAGAREALQRATGAPGFSKSLVRVDRFLAVIVDMENES